MSWNCTLDQMVRNSEKIKSFTWGLIIGIMLTVIVFLSTATFAAEPNLGQRIDVLDEYFQKTGRHFVTFAECTNQKGQTYEETCSSLSKERLITVMKPSKYDGDHTPFGIGDLVGFEGTEIPVIGKFEYFAASGEIVISQNFSDADTQTVRFTFMRGEYLRGEWDGDDGEKHIITMAPANKVGDLDFPEKRNLISDYMNSVKLHHITFAKCVGPKKAESSCEKIDKNTRVVFYGESTPITEGPFINGATGYGEIQLPVWSSGEWTAQDVREHQFRWDHESDSIYAYGHVFNGPYIITKGKYLCNGQHLEVGELPGESERKTQCYKLIE